MGFFSKGFKNEFETAVINEPSVFDPPKFYYIFGAQSDSSVSYKQKKIPLVFRTYEYPKKMRSNQFPYSRTSVALVVMTHERVRNSRGKRAISVRAIEVLLYLEWRK